MNKAEQNTTVQDTTVQNAGMQQVLDGIVADVEVAGIVAEVVKDGERRFGTAGVADLRTGAARQDGEFFHAGSAGKTFTSATVLSMEAEGLLSLDDTVEQHLPGLMSVDVNGYDGNRITLRHLLQNNSGLFPTGLAPEISYRYATRSGFAEHRFDRFTLDELLRVAVSQPPIGQPGERFAYANGGFYIAGAIIEKVSGSSYADEVERRVITPLGLSHTHVRRTAEIDYPNPHPRGYSQQYLKDGVDPASVTAANWETLLEEPGLPPMDVTEFDSAAGYAAGNVVTTTSDLVTLFNALTTGRLLPEAQHRSLWTTFSTEGGYWMPGSRYGLGLFEFDPKVTGGKQIRGIGGSIWGSHCFVLGTPDGEHTIAVHTNHEWKSWEPMLRIVKAEFGVEVAF